MYPDHLTYARDHEWARPEGDRATIGITDYAQEQLSDVVYVDLPPVGAAVTGGEPFGEVKSIKSLSDLYSMSNPGELDQLMDAEARPAPYRGGGRTCGPTRPARPR